MHMPPIIPISLGMKARNYTGLQGPAWFDLHCLLGFIFDFSCLINSASVTVSFSHFLQHGKHLPKYRISTCYSLCLEYFPSTYPCCTPPSGLCSDGIFSRAFDHCSLSDPHPLLYLLFFHYILFALLFIVCFPLLNKLHENSNLCLVHWYISST